MAGLKRIKAGEAYVLVDIVLNEKELEARNAAAKIGEMGDRMMNAGRWGAAAFVATGAAIGLASREAGQYAHEIRRTQVMVGDGYRDLVDWTVKYAESTGYARDQTLSTLNIFLAMGKGMSMASNEAIAFSTEMTRLTQDFAAFTGIPMEEAIMRMKSAMSGSGEVLDMFGINVKETALNAKLLEMELASISQGATELEKMYARLAIIQEASNAMGMSGAALWMHTFPKAMDEFKASIKELILVIGQAFMDDIVALLQWTAQGIRLTADWARQNKTLVKIIGILALGISGLLGSLVIYGAALKVISIVKGIYIVLHRQLALATITQTALNYIYSLSLHSVATAAGMAAAGIGLFTAGLLATLGMGLLLKKDGDAMDTYWKRATDEQLPKARRLKAFIDALIQSFRDLELAIRDAWGMWGKIGLFVKEFSMAVNPGTTMQALIGRSIKGWEYPFLPADKAEAKFKQEAIAKGGAGETTTPGPSVARNMPGALEYGSQAAAEIFYSKSQESQQLKELIQQTRVLELINANIDQFVDAVSGATNLRNNSGRLQGI